MSCRVAVVIVNWDGRHFLGRCLGSLELETFSDFEVVLVDNGSTDGSVSYVEHHFPQVRLICNETNIGFAAANNQAIRATSSEFVVTLNNDTEVDPVWLEELVRVAESDERVGALSSKMLFASGRAQGLRCTGGSCSMMWDCLTRDSSPTLRMWTWRGALNGLVGGHCPSRRHVCSTTIQEHWEKVLH